MHIKDGQTLAQVQHSKTPISDKVELPNSGRDCDWTSALLPKTGVRFDDPVPKKVDHREECRQALHDALGLPPAESIERASAAAIAKHLGSRLYHVREGATEELVRRAAALDDEAYNAARSLLASSNNPEVTRRAENVLRAALPTLRALNEKGEGPPFRITVQNSADVSISHGFNKGWVDLALPADIHNLLVKNNSQVTMTLTFYRAENTQSITGIQTAQRETFSRSYSAPFNAPAGNAASPFSFGVPTYFTDQASADQLQVRAPKSAKFPVTVLPFKYVLNSANRGWDGEQPRDAAGDILHKITFSLPELPHLTARQPLVGPPSSALTFSILTESTKR